MKRKFLRRFILGFYLLLVVLILSITWVQASLRELPSDTDDSFMLGIQVQIPNNINRMNQAYELTEGMSLQWVKLDLSWAELEPERGYYNWEKLDLAMNAAYAHELRPMLTIRDAPDWARERGVNLSTSGPAADVDFVAFVRTVLERYPNQVFALEIWQDQNIDREWTSIEGLNAANYVALVRATYQIVQELSPGTIVISGALAPTGLDDGVFAIDDFRYMQLMIDNGLLDAVDCVGIRHYGYNISPLYYYDNIPNDPDAIFRGTYDYPHHSWTFRSTMDGYLQRIYNEGSDKKLCITGFGWSSAEDLAGIPLGFDFALDNSLAEQAQYFIEAFDLMGANDDIWLAFVNNLNYGIEANWDTVTKPPYKDDLSSYVPFALIRPEMRLSPAYIAIAEWNKAHLQREGR